MIYLFLGDDAPARDQKIIEIKKEIFPSPDALSFDYEVLHGGPNLDSQILKKALVTLPAIAKDRLVVIRQCHKLSMANKALLKEFVFKPYRSTTLILDSDELGPENTFIKEIAPYVKVFRFSHKEQLSVFNLTRAISLSRTVEALNILASLLAKGEYPLQLMGGLVWSWKKSRERMSLVQFSRGLLALQEADVNIKRSRLKAEYALELLVIKLCEANLFAAG